MIAFPNCKINLGLNILRKRADHYHDLETVFYPLSIHDVLEVLPSGNTIHLSILGTPIPGETANNLCVKAYQLLKKDFPDLPAVNLYLYKHIPTGAGLGGGSADGAFTLKLLNDKFKLGLSMDQLTGYALQLGSDCPFFIVNKPCMASGRGEITAPVTLDLSNHSFMLVHPGIHIDTGLAFSKLTPAVPLKSVREIITQPVSSWKAELSNDFEKPVFGEYPVLKAIKEKLYEAGALYASMSGSGSSMYGIFEKNQLPSISFAGNYQLTLLK